MKFLQVHSFYPGYLASYYAHRPELASLSHQEQLTQLKADAFAACHLFAPHLDQSQFHAQLIIANAEPTQRQWATEAGIDPSLPLADILRAQIDSFQPDILYLSDPISYDSNFVQTLNWRPKLILGWRAASIPPQTDWSEFDTILSNHPPTLEEALRRGAHSAHHFQPGFPRFIAESVSAEIEQQDIVFTGSWSAEHATRNKHWMDLALAASQASPALDLRYHFLIPSGTSLPPQVAARNHAAVFGLAMHKALKRSRICLNAMIDLGQGMSANMRLFEIAGTGSFQLMEHHPDITAYFEPGKEIVTYSSFSDMMEKVRYYLDHPVERKEIALRGQQRCLAEHSMERRAAEFGLLVTELLHKVPPTRATGMIGARKAPPTSKPDPLKEQVRTLKQQLKQAEKIQSKQSQQLAMLDKSLIWKLAKPLYKLEQKLRGQ